MEMSHSEMEMIIERTTEYIIETLCQMTAVDRVLLAKAMETKDKEAIADLFDDMAIRR